MSRIVLFCAFFILLACSKEEDPTPTCIEVPERTITLGDSLTIINCNDYVLGISIEGSYEHYGTMDSDTIYLQFDSIGTYIVYYYNAREIAAIDCVDRLTVEVE